MNPEEPQENAAPPTKILRGPRGPYKRYLIEDRPIPCNTISYRVSQNPIPLNNALEADVNRPNQEDGRNDEPHYEPETEENVLDDEVMSEENEPAVNAGENVAPQLEDAGARPLPLIQAYIEKHKLLEKLHKDFKNTRLEVLIMIFHLAIRHCYTQAFVEDQIKFVNALFGENCLDVSWHIFKTLFAPTVPITRHYFCADCEVYVGCNFAVDVITIPCPNCTKEINVKSIDSGNFFVTLSLRHQIEELLKKPGVRIILGEKKSANNVISDVFHGRLYQKCSLDGGPLHKDRNALTISFNTDGAKKFNKTNNSLWPVMGFLNEIIPEQRFKTSNLLVGGLWFGKKAPNMSLYLKPILKELNEMSVNGILYEKPEGGVIQCPVYCLEWSLDAPAKAKVCCQRQFNGGYGCLYCYHPNDATVGDNFKQKYYDTFVEYPLRTEEEVIRDMYKADSLVLQQKLKKDESVRGFVGLSPLLELIEVDDGFPTNPFNMVWGISIDYLHTVMEGVATNLFDLFESILSLEQWNILDSRLKAIRPPQAMTHRPRGISDRVHYRGKEYRALLLYYALPCLEDLLPARNYENLKLLVIAMHILLSDNITQRSVEEGRMSIEKFVKGFQQLYGLQNVTYNLHVCTHLFEMLVQLGPAWCSAMFIFESGNGLLLRLIRGTRCIVNEVSVKFTALLTAAKIIENIPVSVEAISFCNDLLGCNFVKNSKDFGDVCALGHKSTAVIDVEEAELLSGKNVKVIENKVMFYNRVILKGNVFCSKSYSKAKAFDDSCVTLVDGSYAVIDKLVESDSGDLLCLIKPMRISHNLTSSIKRCSYDVYRAHCVVPFSQVMKKCVLIHFEDKSFVCDIPNFYERD